MLEVDQITTRYGAITALHSASLEVRAGELVALVGPNGAGKTTLLNTVAGLLRPATGSIRFEGNDITGTEPARLVRAGLALVPEHRRIFKDLTVEENLRLGGSTASAHDRRERLEEAADLFPVLRTKWTTSAGYLSGGEAQQLAVARALMSNPRLLLLDEPAAGMNPTETESLMELIHFVRERFRLSILLIEHQMRVVMGICEWITVMDFGQLIARGTAQEIQSNETVIEAYLGRRSVRGT